MTIGGLAVAVVLLAAAFTAKINWLKTFVLGGVFTWLTGYVILLAIGSIFSVERTLSLGEPKEFCGFYFDCHMHTAVTGVRTAKTIGDKTANGEFRIVKVKVFSDAGRATLALNTVDAKILDDQKREYQRDLAAEASLGEQPSFEKKISPSESFEKEIVFDLPADAANPRLDLHEGYGIDHAIEAILVGDEDSIFHRRNYFKLSEQTAVAGVK
jgi:hypothetical protein